MKSGVRPERGRPMAGTLAILVVVLGFLFNLVGRGIGDSYMVFLLPIGDEMAWSRSRLASVYSVYMLSLGLSAPLIGLLFDRWGPRLVYCGGVVCLAVSCFMAARLSSLAELYFYIGLLSGIGVSAAGMVPAASLISRWFPNNTGTAIGLAYAGMGCGTLLLVPLSQYLNQLSGWRNAYHYLSIGLIVVAALALLLPWGSLSAGLGLKEPKDASHSAKPAGSAQLAALRHAMHMREYWALVQVFFFTGMAIYTVLVQVVAFLVESGFDPLVAATAFGTAGMLSVLGVSTSGILADRIGYRSTATISFVGTSLGLLALLCMSWRPWAWCLIVFVGTFGLAQGARGPIVSALSARFFQGRGLATVYGTIYAFMSVGAAIGSLMSGVLHDTTDGYQASFYFSMLCVACALAPFWVGDALQQRQASVRGVHSGVGDTTQQEQ